MDPSLVDGQQHDGLHGETGHALDGAAEHDQTSKERLRQQLQLELRTCAVIAFDSDCSSSSFWCQPE